MPKDLPDWSTKITISHEVSDSDLTTTDHKKIKGVPLKDPSVAAAVPISVENPAIAYDSQNDCFKIRGTAAGQPVYIDLRAVTGKDLTARDWSGDFAKLQNIPTDPAKESGKLTDIFNLENKTLNPASITATASGTTQIKAPATGKSLRVKLIKVHNSGTAAVTVDLRFTAGGSAHFKGALASGGGFAINLIGCNWLGGVNEILYVNLSAAGTVDVSVMVDEV